MSNKRRDEPNTSLVSYDCDRTSDYHKKYHIEVAMGDEYDDSGMAISWYDMCVHVEIPELDRQIPLDINSNT